MKSCLEVDVAMSSMAQHASPKFITHNEYLRPQFNMNLTGWGISTSSRMLTAKASLGKLSRPLEHLLSVRVQQPQGQDEHEDGHLHDCLVAQALEDGGPGEQEHALHVEDHEQEGVDVVTDLGLRPPLADRVDAALVGGQLLGERAMGGDDPGRGEFHGYQSEPCDQQGDHDAVGLVVGLHALLPNRVRTEL